ncbi:diphosphomevalonate decarboxylase [Pseudoclavibacter endophyticus]|uniref:diphosphomevalonate decarboxylase n=1 Tax=Pseudoclavibacter endophyticus TaxID=1778590 RepID=A0A6H9WGG7_9MICO|nr:diphosphomevalonate decarboxylase [Pseudoclavibacter endophyticus]KAB1650049.1 diphosphomevalonate decarboxylase [Pseudoclavibacter endophyticus]GGA57672.1 diphosphomevalonate decarboxylase [Pseudoclavibacter endophyticus]
MTTVAPSAGAGDERAQTSNASATARAYPNIALVKYWGKRDERLMLPAAGSLSLTLDVFPTETTVTVDPGADRDRFELDGAPASEEQTGRVTRFLDLVRERAGTTARAVVRSTNAAPTGAGLASSASGFAALAVSAAAAYRLDADRLALSRLARRGSGSAARSIVPGVAVWHAGEDDGSSFAEPVDAPPLSMVIVTIDRAMKAVSSREAMRRTALTSPFHAAWISDTAQALEAMLVACRDGDFTRIGRITETNALRMHAVIQSADPPIQYLAPTSVAAFDEVRRLRAEGLEAYATADAGPNVVALARPADAEAVADALAHLGETTIAGPGPGAALVEPAGGTA